MEHLRTPDGQRDSGRTFARIRTLLRAFGVDDDTTTMSRQAVEACRDSRGIGGGPRPLKTTSTCVASFAAFCHP